MITGQAKQKRARLTISRYISARKKQSNLSIAFLLIAALIMNIPLLTAGVA
ncbi:sulfurtransferase [Lacticaseibacillus paracasei]|nr:sulfurtransferase [Lacticaseibacillus paracasei]